MNRSTERPASHFNGVGSGIGLTVLALALVLACSATPRPAPDAPAAARPPDTTSAEPTPAPPERIRYGYSATSLSYFYLQVGEATGLYQREGLAPELLHLPASTLLAALLAGEVDYSAGAAGGVRLAVRGQGVRLLSTISLLNFSLIARPEIDSGATLRGKIVGVGSRGAAADRAAQRAVRSLGLDPQNDVTIVVIGDQPLQLEALRTGRIDAAMSSPPQSVQGTREGFRVLANTAELEPAVIGGLVATTERLASARDRTRRLLRAEWEIVRFMKRQPAETAALLAAQFNMDFEDAAAAYAQTVPYYWDRLDLNLPAVENTILAEREAGEVAEDVPLDRVADGRLLAELQTAETRRP